jgi:hypothetical protein
LTPLSPPQITAAKLPLSTLSTTSQGHAGVQRVPTGSNGATCSNAFQRGHRFSDSLEDLNCCCLGYLPLLHWLHVVAFFSANVPFKLHKRVTS